MHVCKLRRPSKCPVSAYILYQIKRPEGYSNHDDPFNISAVTNEKRTKLEDRWFNFSPMGVYLNGRMRRISKNTALPDNKRKTNTSVRKSLSNRPHIPRFLTLYRSMQLVPKIFNP